MGDEAEVSDAVAINLVQLLLAEERTAMSVMRTGIAVLALPLSVLSLLVATSRYYEAQNVLHLLLPLGLLCLSLLAFGLYLVVLAVRKLRRIDRLVQKIKQQHDALAPFLDPDA